MTTSRSGEGFFDRLLGQGTQGEFLQDRIADALQKVRREGQRAREGERTTRSRVRLDTTFRGVVHGLGRPLTGATAVAGLPAGADLLTRRHPSEHTTVFLALSSGGPTNVEVEFR